MVKEKKSCSRQKEKFKKVKKLQLMFKEKEEKVEREHFFPAAVFVRGRAGSAGPVCEYPRPCLQGNHPQRVG